MAATTNPRTYEFSFDPLFRPASLLFGISARNAWVELTDTSFLARFGRWQVNTPLDNIAAARITGPYLYIKTAGPARLGITDRGLTFASNARAGVELDFVEPISGIDPLGVIRHPNLTVTVADPDALISDIRQLMKRRLRGA